MSEKNAGNDPAYPVIGAPGAPQDTSPEYRRGWLAGVESMRQELAQQPAEYADADALIAHLDSLCDESDEKWDVAQAAIAGIRAFQQPAVVGDDLDFEPDEHHTVADMANVGYSLMQAIKQNRPDYAWNESPAEIVVDLLNEIEQAALTPAATPGLHPATADLVARFSAALAEKLSAAERKYGYSDGWSSPEWMDECRQKLVEHIAKGDPRDVAAYCAFLWHHGESTAQKEGNGNG